MVRCVFCKIALYHRNILRHITSIHPEYYDVFGLRSRYEESVELGGTRFMEVGSGVTMKKQVKNWAASVSPDYTGFRRFVGRTKEQAEVLLRLFLQNVASGSTVRRMTDTTFKENMKNLNYR